jgi:hypothetical protein
MCRQLVRLPVAAALIAAALSTFFVPPPASGSELVGRGVSPVGLQVDGQGRALVVMPRRRLLASGAVNARPPSRMVPQVSFQLRYGGRLPNGGSCPVYDGPPLAWLVVACKAPDGSYWALQRWQRLRPNYGGVAGPFELRLSHWTGDLAQLQVGVDWSYGRFDHLYGRVTYAGRPVYGFRATRSGVPLDTYGRNLFLDTLDSAYGSGWRRENSFLAQSPNGQFCYGFYPHRQAATGKGTRYRLTVIGPGVTPDVTWEGAAPGAFDPAIEREATAAQQALDAGGGPNGCRPR